MSRLRVSLWVVAFVGLGVAGCGGLGSGSSDGGSDDQSEGQWFLEGTCVLTSNNGERVSCSENWGLYDGGSENISEERQKSKAACTGEWTSAEEACPTDDVYVGTCRQTTDGGQPVQETYYYEGNVYTEDTPSECEMDGNTWVVE
jgi:hypothetical protein